MVVDVFCGIFLGINDEIFCGARSSSSWVGWKGERLKENHRSREPSVRIVGRTNLLSEALSSSTVSHASRASGEAGPNFLAASTAAATACVTSGRDVLVVDDDDDIWRRDDGTNDSGPRW